MKLSSLVLMLPLLLCLTKAPLQAQRAFNGVSQFPTLEDHNLARSGKQEESSLYDHRRLIDTTNSGYTLETIKNNNGGLTRIFGYNFYCDNKQVLYGVRFNKEGKAKFYRSWFPKRPVSYIDFIKFGEHKEEISDSQFERAFIKTQEGECDGHRFFYNFSWDLGT